jgi:MFS family permease
MRKYITKSVLLLSLVSLFTDISSEMLYPVMPMFLSSIGFSALFIGIFEGIAEAVAGFSKGWFGKLSDNMGRRAPFVQSGYFLSSISKPMMALILHPVWILFARTLDRTGKGIRTGARDALLSAGTSPEFKGRVFGFHRAFDTIGAAIGPIIALIFLNYFPGNYRELFYWAFIPAIIGVAFTFFVKDKQIEKPIEKKKNGLFEFIKYWKIADKSYKKLVIALLAFALANSSDILLLLMAKHQGLPDEMVIIVYIFYNIVYAIFSYPMGWLGDRIGLKWSFVIGLVLFAVMYSGIALTNDLTIIFILFFIYGIYAAATEGVSKAWITNIAKKEETATAIGFYTGWQSVCTLLASTIAGLLWTTVGASFPFMISSVATIFVAIYLVIAFKGKKY